MKDVQAVADAPFKNINASPKAIEFARKKAWISVRLPEQVKTAK
ncbi:hypothetical protein [Maridesulfovibrio sp.]